MAKTRVARVGLLLCGVSLVAACDDGQNVNLFKGKSGGDAEVASLDADPSASVKLIERDVEAPEVFEAIDQGLWDGRPSLGGVWVAHPDVDEPERVIIRNTESGKFVIGALFKRERENPGPRFQVSSDAASALGMLAGAPDSLSVTALRRQEVPEELPPAAVAAAAPPSATPLPPSEEIQTATLDPIAAASAALDRVEDKPATATAAAPAKPTPTQTRAPTGARSKLDKPFIQVGMFSVRQNAENTSTSLRGAGVLPAVREESHKGKTYYRVTVGPAPTSADRSAMLKKVKGLGFTDAYFVKN